MGAVWKGVEGGGPLYGGGALLSIEEEGGREGGTSGIEEEGGREGGMTGIDSSPAKYPGGGMKMVTPGRVPIRSGVIALIAGNLDA